MTISPDVQALHIITDRDCDTLRAQWSELVEDPARQAGLKPPPLVEVESPYRFVIRPVLDYVLELERTNPHRVIAVIIPELVERRWYYNLLHNHRSAVLKALLLFQGCQHVTVINIPWYLPTERARW
jgi:hypothetical protein